MQGVCNKETAVTVAWAKLVLLLASQAQAPKHKDAQRPFKRTSTAEIVKTALSAAHAFHTGKLLPAITLYAL